LRVAEHLAEAALGRPPDAVVPIPSLLLPPPSTHRDGLPRIGVVTNLQGQAVFKDVYFYGRTVAGMWPTLVEPAELEDGALVSGQYGHAALRNPTCVYQHHPVVHALLRRHGIDLHFAGLILSPEPEDAESKELMALHTVRLARLLSLDGVIVSKEGGGNADADMIGKADRLEEAGIPAVGIVPEMAGRDGTAPGLITLPRRARTFVSVGNYDERVELPPVERVIGARNEEEATNWTGPRQVPIAMLHAALNPLGWGHLTLKEELG
jgi:glycine reductase